MTTALNIPDREIGSTNRLFNLDEHWSDPCIDDVEYLKNAAEILQWDYPEQAAILYGHAVLFGLKIIQLGSPEQVFALFGDSAMVNITDCMIKFGTHIQDIDPDFASYWFEMAASLGNNDAFGYYIELWVDKDQPRSMKLTEQILASSDPELIFESAMQLENVNIDVAIDMLKAATDLGSVNAPNELGRLLIRKTTRNKKEAMRFFKLGAERGNSHALIALAEMLEKDNPSRAADLYEHAFYNSEDGCVHPEAAAKLVRLVKGTEPKRALALFDEMMHSIDIKSKNDYANEIESLDPEKAKKLYADAAIVEEEDIGFYYESISAKRSGLPVRLMASSIGNKKNTQYNPPHIYVANNHESKGGVFGETGFKVSLSKDPQVLEGENKLTAEDWISVKEFIVDNYDALFEYWTHANECGSADLYELLFPDYSLNRKEERTRKITEALMILSDDNNDINSNDPDYMSPLEMFIIIMKTRIKK